MEVNRSVCKEIKILTKKILLQIDAEENELKFNKLNGEKELSKLIALNFTDS